MTRVYNILFTILQEYTQYSGENSNKYWTRSLYVDGSFLIYYLSFSESSVTLPVEFTFVSISL